MRILGIEGGATKTSAALIDTSDGTVLARAKAGLSNTRLLTVKQLASIFHSIQKQIGQSPDIISACLAGALTRVDHRMIREAAARVWPRAKCVSASDRESALMAAFGKREGIVVICGTGSSTFGMRRGKMAKCGGWGHLLGDRGSAYDIALDGLRSAIQEYDRTGKVGTLARGFLRALSCNTPEEWVDWIQHSAKADVAACSFVVFDAAKKGDRLAKQVLNRAGDHLAESVRVVAAKLHWRKPSICLTGGVFANQPRLFNLVRSKLRGWEVHPPRCDGAVGAALLATTQPVAVRDLPSTVRPMKDVAAALTEQRNPRTLDIDKKSVADLFDLMTQEESHVIPALREKKREVVNCIETITAAFRRGGRLFYVGAGTSGRLGMLDASECPPTFSVPADMVQAIMAGGMRALYASVEEAEDDPEAGALAIRNRGVGRRDVVVGIAASGRTPFVRGALAEAAGIGARTFLLTFNPESRITDHKSRIETIAIATGPEVITGSTRLKAGTATKLILNMLTTISMIRLGKVVSNLMVDVKPTNQKLRDRACRIVMALKQCTYDDAWKRLTHANWNVKKAI